jgi:hypothetical protein
MPLNDSAVLGVELTFRGRVQAAMLAACVAIANEGIAVVNHAARLQLVHSILSSPSNLSNYAQMFELSVATDTAVLNLATATGTVPLTTGNVVAQQALATDTAITNAVNAQFNSYCAQIAA